MCVYVGMCDSESVAYEAVSANGSAGLLFEAANLCPFWLLERVVHGPEKLHNTHVHTLAVHVKQGTSSSHGKC